MMHVVLLGCVCVVIVNSLQVAYHSLKLSVEKKISLPPFPNIPCRLGHDVFLKFGAIHMHL